MRSTFTKIFLSFWLAQFLITVCTIFISIRQFESIAIAYTSSFAMMQTMAKQSISAYESGGCEAFNRVPNTFILEKPKPTDQPALLIDSSNKLLCQQVDLSPLASTIERVRKDGYSFGERHGANYLVGLEVKDDHGQKFVYLLRGSYPSKGHIPWQEMLPRLIIGLIVSIVVTFCITLVITRPIGSLREAARQLTAGNLAARAKWRNEETDPRTTDELRGLVYDFNEMAEQLESLVDSHKLLLRDVSHELRSPLARLSVALEWAREEAQPGIEEQFERMENETVRLNALINQLLNLSHLESTSRLPAMQPVSISGIVDELLPDMEYEAHARNCQISFSNSAPSSSEISGSPELLGRAIENVIRNAIAYTTEGTSVEIQLSSQSKAGRDFVVLQVRDHGPGVPEASLKSIFRPFYRLDGSRQRSTGGFGVGLAITERAVKLHGGDVEARNAADGGLIIELCFPVAHS